MEYKPEPDKKYGSGFTQNPRLWAAPATLHIEINSLSTYNKTGFIPGCDSQKKSPPVEPKLFVKPEAFNKLLPYRITFNI